MSRQRKEERSTQKFYCPFCQQRLWRLGGPQYYLISQSRTESQSSYRSELSASQTLVDANPNRWLEEFFCEEHGNLWMLLSTTSDGRCDRIVGLRFALSVISSNSYKGNLVNNNCGKNASNCDKS